MICLPGLRLVKLNGNIIFSKEDVEEAKRKDEQKSKETGIKTTENFDRLTEKAKNENFCTF